MPTVIGGEVMVTAVMGMFMVMDIRRVVMGDRIVV
jgi:hypothetical protein